VLREAEEARNRGSRKSAVSALEAAECIYFVRNVDQLGSIFRVAGRRRELLGSFGMVCGTRLVLPAQHRKLLNSWELRGIGFFRK
jgi:hypothetical protein